MIDSNKTARLRYPQYILKYLCILLYICFPLFQKPLPIYNPHDYVKSTYHIAAATITATAPIPTPILPAPPVKVARGPDAVVVVIVPSVPEGRDVAVVTIAVPLLNDVLLTTTLLAGPDAADGVLVL